MPFGDRAFLVETGEVAAAHDLAAHVRELGERGDAPVAIDEVVVGFACVLVVLDPGDGDTGADAAAAWLEQLVVPGGGRGATGPRGPASHLLPVAFDGDDLVEVAGLVGTTPDVVVGLLVAAELEVAFVGFAPGFPYLTGLPPELASLPRRPTPRTSVPAGSVAVAGGFASVYPRSSPGGWHLLGRTAEPLFDPAVAPFARVSPGDLVRFTVADPRTAVPPPTDVGRPLLRAGAGPALHVLEPGMLSLVQDAGRRGAGGIGVPRAGAADPRALELVNLLLGNDPGAAAVECTASGPTVRVVGRGHVAVVGAEPGSVDVRVDGHPVADAAVVPVDDGQVLSVGRSGTGLRAYLGVSGGLRTPEMLGSRSSDVLSGLGPGPLRAGDHLGRGRPGRARGRLDLPRAAAADGTASLRVLPGPHVRTDDPAGTGPFDDLVATEWRVGTDADRIGVRLGPADGAAARPSGPTVTRPSVPMITGAVQLPPDGRPIVLLPDHATVGGYPVVACVISADLPLLGQLVPGQRVRFVAVDPETASAELLRYRLGLAALVSGWFPVTAAT
ncbi:MAG: carboxyltransferase domain-containing protein [Acidimicrobiales bacterium]